MIRESELSEAGRKYAAAYEVHYTAKDLREALKLYRDLIAEFPKTREADYCRSQILNIVNAVISKQDMSDAYMHMASDYFEREGQTVD